MVIITWKRECVHQWALFQSSSSFILLRLFPEGPLHVWLIHIPFSACFAAWFWFSLETEPHSTLLSAAISSHKMSSTIQTMPERKIFRTCYDEHKVQPKTNILCEKYGLHQKTRNCFPGVHCFIFLSNGVVQCFCHLSYSSVIYDQTVILNFFVHDAFADIAYFYSFCELAEKNGTLFFSVTYVSQRILLPTITGQALVLG